MRDTKLDTHIDNQKNREKIQKKRKCKKQTAGTSEKLGSRVT
jgi:hypothetical protein